MSVNFRHGATIDAPRKSATTITAHSGLAR
jgi:hypothetical protein